MVYTVRTQKTQNKCQLGTAANMRERPQDSPQWNQFLLYILPLKAFINSSINYFFEMQK